MTCKKVDLFLVQKKSVSFWKAKGNVLLRMLIEFLRKNFFKFYVKKLYKEKQVGNYLALFSVIKNGRGSRDFFLFL